MIMTFNNNDKIRQYESAICFHIRKKGKTFGPEFLIPNLEGALNMKK